MTEKSKVTRETPINLEDVTSSIRWWKSRLSMAESETFDGVSVAEQDKRKCVLFLQLSTMETTKGITGKHKPKNTELPSPVCTSSEVTITAVVNVSGTPKTYTWHKEHGGKISKCEIKLEKRQLKVTLTKAQQVDWGDTFLDHLQEV